MGNRPLVSVFYLCYNQKEFVEESMRSILSQETDFEIELLIHDDASTDGTAEIVRRLAAADQRIKPILRAQCTLNRMQAVENHIRVSRAGNAS